eukprot:ANDGO_08222.mRNA.1 putative polygalacturonase
MHLNDWDPSLLLIVVSHAGCLVGYESVWRGKGTAMRSGTEMRTLQVLFVVGALVGALVGVGAVHASSQCVITDYGAVGDGKTDCMVAILKAIAACAGNVQTPVVVPSGEFLSSPFNLTSNLALVFEKNAKLVAVSDASAYPVVAPLPSYGAGRESKYYRYAPFVGCYECTNLYILGHGDGSSVIDGSGDSWWLAHREKKLTITRPHLMEIAYSKNIHIEGIKLANSPFWTLHPYVCDQVVIRNVHTFAPAVSPNTDGIDPDSSTNVLIENCLLEAGDDAISIKSGINECGRAYGRPSANVTVRNSFFGPSLGFAIGSEMSGDVYNVTVEHCTFSGSVNAIRFKTGRGRGGRMFDIAFRNNTVDGVAQAIFVNEYYAHVDHQLPPVETPRLYNVEITGLRGVAVEAGTFACLPEAPCQFVLRDIEIAAPVGFKCENATGSASSVFPKSCLVPS